MTFRCRAVLLDMDGTLVDSTVAVEAQWGRWAARHGLQLADVLRVSHGRPSMETMRILAPDAATPEEHERFMREEEAHEAGTVAVAGALDFVSRLPRDRWAVVTSAPRTLAGMRIAAAGFPAPPVLIAPEDVTHGKPHPEPYLLAAALLGVPPAACLVVEDTRAGLESAAAAGMTAIGIATTYTREQLACPCTVADFRALSVASNGDDLAITLLDTHMAGTRPRR
jgi:mannitol-1-/sugar-/sorbitol-6-phosphatase